MSSIFLGKFSPLGASPKKKGGCENPTKEFFFPKKLAQTHHTIFFLGKICFSSVNFWKKIATFLGKTCQTFKTAPQKKKKWKKTSNLHEIRVRQNLQLQ